MKLFIKNKLISIGGSSVARDENDNEVYKIKGAVFSVTRKKKIMDAEGNVLYKVRNKYWRLFMNSAYIFDGNGEKIARVQRRFSIKNKYTFVGYNEEIRVEGSVMGWNFQVYADDVLIGQIARKFTIAVDSFILDVVVEKYASLLVALVICIDNITDNNQKSSR